MKQELFLNYKKAPAGVYIRGNFGPINPVPRNNPDSFIPYNYLEVLRGISRRRMFK